MATNQSIHLVGGIRTWSSKYWNCEKFNFQLSANAPVLKQKQTFTLEPTDDGKWRIKSWLGKYLSAHELGEVSCKADEAGANETFTFEFLKGLVAIKSVHGKYVSADENNVSQKPTLGERELFDIVFSIHPHVVIRSFEGRFVKVEGDDVVCNSNLQFGAGTVLHLEYENNGKYAFGATNGKYFSVGADGVVKATATSKGENELFWFELYGKKVAIKSANGNFLTPDGQKGTLKTKGDKLSNREQYDLLTADPQISLKASSGKYVSVQEANLMCNRNEHGADESFSFEWVKDNVYGVRSTSGKFWSLRDGVIHVDVDSLGEKESFAINYHPDGKVSFKNEAGGKTYYASAKAVGGVKGAAVSEPSENELFECEILNKPQVALRAKQLGFVGLVGEKVSAGKTSPDVFTIEYKDGKYLLRAPSGDFVSIGAGDAITVNARNQSPVYIEFNQGKMAFKTTDGEYLLSDDQGNFIVGPQAAAPPAEALFDF